MLGFGQTLPFVLLGIICSFVFARACLAAGVGDGKVERWLIYPSLIVGYLPTVVAMLLWPLAAAILTEGLLTDPGIFNGYLLSWRNRPPACAITALTFLTIASLWWAILGLIAWRWPALVRAVFAPFARHFRSRTLFLVLSVVCLLVFLACAELWHLQVQRIRDIQAHPAPPPSPATARNELSGP